MVESDSMPGANTTSKRRIIFWNTCIVLRLMLASLAVSIDANDARVPQIILGVYLGAWGVGLISKFYKSRHEEHLSRAIQTLPNGDALNTTQADLDVIRYGNFGGVVWWNAMRPVHGCLLVLYGAFSIADIRHASHLLVVDVGVAIAAGAAYYSRPQGS